MPSDFQRVKNIFLAAVEQTEPWEREACLREACEDDTGLRRRVEALLRRHEQADSLLDRPAFEPPAIPGRQPNENGDAGADLGHEATGTRLGPYKLLQRIGEGGMGAVWMAEQQAPVRRLVALKVVRVGLDSAHGVARFEAERQALAMMDHPNIAKVLDAGTTEDNRPYFVMELVKGTLITQYCDEHRLTPRQRMELFVPVCQALQHAHQKGIIHRDVKPSNVLVAPYDGRPIVKVIDFGVAKAVGPRLTERTLYTEFGTVVGTLEYMSPEQAELNNQDIDTRSDVYSLGVLLYELLTGTTPLTAKRIKETAFLEVLRAIREDEPPRPSTRLSGSHESLKSIATTRHTDRARLRRLLLGELDWIVMKALEKDRGRRYQTANALARDVERYLNDETVEARPPSAGYRLGKILRRNKGPAAAATGILTTLVLGLIGTLIFAMGEAEQRRQAGLNARLAEEGKNAALYQAYWAHLAAAGAALQIDDVADAARQLQRAPEEFRHWEWYHLRARLDDSTSAIHADVGEFQSLVRDKSGIRIASWSNTDLGLTDLEGNKILTSSLLRELNLIEHPLVPTRHGLWLAGTRRETEGSSVGVPRSAYKNSNDLRLIDNEGRVQFELKGPPGALFHLLAVSPDGSRLAVCWEEPGRWVVTTYDADSGKPGSTSTEDRGEPWALVFSPDGTRIATGGEDGVVRLWDTTSGALIDQFRGHSRKLVSIAFRPDGRRFLTTSADGTVRQWDSTSGREAESPYERHTGMVVTAAYSPDGQWIASVGTDRTIRVWSAARRQDVAILHGHTGEVRELAFTDDGRRLVSVSPWGANGVSNEGAVRIWEVGLQGGESVLHGHSTYVYPVAFSPDGRWIASGAWDHSIRLWDAATGEQCATLPHPGVVWCLAFSPDGTWLLSGGDFRGEMLIWDVATGKLRGRIRAPGDRVHYLALSPDGTRTAVGWCGSENRLTMGCVNVATGEVVAAGPGVPFAFSPDGKWLAGRDDREKRVVLWDVRNFRQVVELPGHAAPINAIAFSRDSRRFVSASSDRTVRLWDTATGECLRVFEGHPDMVFSAVFHPDGERLASAGRDGTVWLWDLKTGQKVARLDGHTNYVYSLAFSPDGRSLASGSGDGTVRLWDTLPLAEHYQARRQAESLRPEADRLVERRLKETKDPAAVVAAFRADRLLGEPLRQAALRAALRRFSP
jgi:WD40 repeat protein/serine/threonine protein kinase